MKRQRSFDRASRSAAATVLVCAGTSIAQSPPAREGGPVMPPAAPATGTSVPAVRGWGAWGVDIIPATLTQVNVNATGLNIVGDAANEPSFTIDPTAPNRVAAGWRQFDTIASNFRQAGRAYSRDAGRSWTNPGVLDPGIFRSDPVLASTSAGTFYYLSLTNTGPGGFSCQLFTSTDGGSTFGPPVQATGGDKSWFIVDTTPTSGAGFLYQAWSIGGVASQAFSRSTSAGASWQNPPTTGVPVWGTLAQNSAGDLFVGGIPTAGSATTSFRCARSSNARNSALTPTFTTFTVPFGGQIGFNLASSPNPGGLLGQVSVAVDRSGGPRNGWVYMLCSVVPTGGLDACDVYFQRSTDNGATWLAAPIRVNNDAPSLNAYQWFGTMSVAPDGRIDAIWNDTRESQQPNLSRVYYATSSDGGTTWTGNTPVSPQFDSYLGFPQQNKIGDYSHMISDRVGASAVIAATFNGEQDVYLLRINDYDCNSNGIPDAQEIALGLVADCNANGIPDTCEAAAGVIVTCPCYANCDASTGAPLLTAADFTCFLSKFRAGDPYANCDGSTDVPTLSATDFACFLNAFRAGCP